MKTHRAVQNCRVLIIYMRLSSVHKLSFEQKHGKEQMDPCGRRPDMRLRCAYDGAPQAGITRAAFKTTVPLKAAIASQNLKKRLTYFGRVQSTNENICCRPLGSLTDYLSALQPTPGEELGKNDGMTSGTIIAY